MSHKTALPMEARSLVDNVVDQIIESFGDRSIRKWEIAVLTADEIERLRHRRTTSEQRKVIHNAINSLVIDGLASRAEERLKMKRSVFYAWPDSPPVSLPQRVGMQDRDDSGLKQDSFTQRQWYQLTWEELSAVIEEHIDQRDRLDKKIDIYRRVLRLRQRYPNTRTPLEACERAGKDPNDFHLEDVL